MSNIRFGEPRARNARIAIAGGAVLLAALLVAAYLWTRPAAEMRQPAAAGQTATAITLTPQQRATAAIVVEALTPTPMARIIRAPGEVQSNEYTANLVSPRITATVVARHARLGDRVRRGQPLVTLFSVDVAEAQSALVLAEQDFARMERVGREIVAGQQYDAAAVERQEARGRLESYGIAPEQVTALANGGLAAGRAGQFDLVAGSDGIVVRDDFRLGEVLEAGRPLFEIADPRVVWITARVSPDAAALIAGKTGKISAGNLTRQGRVIQVGDVLDEKTRTIQVRLEADNPDRTLKPGQFVDVELYGREEPVLALPTEAVLRDPAGAWTVYVESRAGAFEPKPVQVLYPVNELTVISGIPAGSRVVTKGAFFIMSEAAKAGFADEH
jgi:cobalt-zinc-cadmium efflux system membrane fusion protein